MMKETLCHALSAMRIALTEDRIDCLVRYGEMVIAQNRIMNLTAITEPDAVAQLHLADSVSLLLAGEFSGKKVIDVGTGAGMPGIPLKIACPEVSMTLLDATKKKMDWIAGILPTLAVEAECICARAEEYAQTHRACYDAAVSRAVARLPVLCEICLPFLKTGGVLYALKGPEAEEELREAKNAIRILGGSPDAIFPVESDDTKHCVIRIQKTAPTPQEYPRSWGRIKKKPL